MIKWGIIGAGNIAHRFCKALAFEEDAKLYAIAGRNEEKLLKFKEEYPCEKTYTSFEDLLHDENVDAVYIALPHHMHKEWAVKALQAHKAVLSEKPAVMNAEEMKEIAAVSKKENTLYMEAMKSRFVPAFAKVKEIIEEGKIGEIVSVKAENCFLIPKEMYGKSYHTQPGVGGALLDSGCYCVNWLNAFLKGDPVLKKTYANARDGVDYYIDARLQFENGEGQIIAAFDRRTEAYAEIIGTKGKLYIEHPQRPDVIHLYEEGNETIITLPYIHDDFYGQIHHFDSLIKEGKTESDVMSFTDSIRNAYIMDVIRTGFTDYTKQDLKVLEEQEKALSYESFDNEDALILAEQIIELQKEYDRGIALRIVRESDGLVMFQYVMKDKNANNIMYAEGKHNAIKEYGHSSAWVNVAFQTEGFVLKEGVLPSGGAFPIYLKDGTLAASVLLSGLHEGKDHELIIRAISDVQDCEYPDFIKALG